MNDSFQSGEPISVFIDNNNGIFAVIDADTYAKFEIGELDSYLMGLYYFNVDTPDYFLSDSIDVSLKCFGLLLPKLSRDEDNYLHYEDLTVTGVYTVITNNWAEIQQDRTFRHYQYSVQKSV